MTSNLNKESFSGEVSDFASSTNNNEYGRAHNTGNILYGTWQPTKKYSDEIYSILSKTIDDKSEKRQIRLNFLIDCQMSHYIASIFPIYTNINGGGCTRT